ncbi:hypothetical protein [Streptomyces sp. TLI_105]|uniref:hypothetical protein n=1 Tax=Streptomyces sp. TLI_105 TaxID=1881019 RepID=UPI002108A13D|nr:hypothetical protein [Streptomyces sp. TLI_105]
MRFLSGIRALSRSSHRKAANRREHLRKHRIVALGAGCAGKPKHLGGKAARIKGGILGMSLWTTSHPTFGLPRRRHRLTAATGPSAEKAAAQNAPAESAVV